MSDDPYELKPQPPKPAPPAEPAPGEAAPSAGPSSPTGFVPPTPLILGPDDTDPDIKDAEDNRVTAILGYLVFLVPLLLAPKSKFCRFHANQALVAQIAFVVILALIIIFQIVWTLADLQFPVTKPVLSPLGTCVVMPILCIFLLATVVLAVTGIINAANGERKPLHVIGNIKLLK